jgi:hypothetical protein
MSSSSLLVVQKVYVRVQNIIEGDRGIVYPNIYHQANAQRIGITRIHINILSQL